jgi:hypothetical protein
MKSRMMILCDPPFTFILAPRSRANDINGEAHDKNEQTSMRGPERPIYLDPLFAIADACVVEC